MDWNFQVIVTPADAAYETVHMAALELPDYQSVVYIIIEEQSGDIVDKYAAITCNGNVYLHYDGYWFPIRIEEGEPDGSAVLNLAVEPPEVHNADEIIRAALVDYWQEVMSGNPDPERIPEYAKKLA